MYLKPNVITYRVHLYPSQCYAMIVDNIPRIQNCFYDRRLSESGEELDT